MQEVKTWFSEFILVWTSEANSFSISAEAMLSESKLIELLKSPESHWVERKPSGVGTEDIRNTLVAFANSVSKGQAAVLFIGISNDGTLQGVENADKMQKDVTRIAKERCYPPVKCEPTAFRVDGVELVAAVVEESSNRPHFSGHAFIRVGSETKKASSDLFEELIASRNEKARRLLQERKKVVTISWSGEQAPDLSEGRPWTSGRPFEAECRITACDSMVLRFDVIAIFNSFRGIIRASELSRASKLSPISPKSFSVPVEKVTISFDNENQRAKLIINF